MIFSSGSPTELLLIVCPYRQCLYNFHHVWDGISDFGLIKAEYKMFSWNILKVLIEAGKYKEVGIEPIL